MVTSKVSPITSKTTLSINQSRRVVREFFCIVTQYVFYKMNEGLKCLIIFTDMLDRHLHNEEILR